MVCLRFFASLSIRSETPALVVVPRIGEDRRFVFRDVLFPSSNLSPRRRSEAQPRPVAGARAKPGRRRPFGVPVEPTLPGTVGRREEEVRPERLRHLRALRQLPVAVRRGRAHPGAGPPGRSVIAFPAASALFRSTRWRGVGSGHPPTGETTAPPVPPPITVPASRSPVRALSPTSSGRPEMSLLPGMWPRPAWRPLSGPASFRGGGGWSTALRRPRGPPGRRRISAARRPCRGPPAGGGPGSVPGSGPLRLRHHLLPALPGGLPRRGEAFLRARFRLYPRPPALRRSPRDTVDGSRPGRFAMAASVRPPFPVAWIRHLTSRVGWRWPSGMTLSHGSHRDRRRYPADSRDAAPTARPPTINGVALQSGTGIVNADASGGIATERLRISSPDEFHRCRVRCDRRSVSRVIGC